MPCGRVANKHPTNPFSRFYRQAGFSHPQNYMRNICKYLEISAKIMKINDLRKSYLGNQRLAQSQVENQ
jgi:hypothetical protein